MLLECGARDEVEARETGSGVWRVTAHLEISIDLASEIERDRRGGSQAIGGQEVESIPVL